MMNMMGFGYGYSPMMYGGFGGFGIFAILGFLTWIVVLVVGILLAIYLWQKINKK